MLDLHDSLVDLTNATYSIVLDDLKVTSEGKNDRFELRAKNGSDENALQIQSVDKTGLRGTEIELTVVETNAICVFFLNKKLVRFPTLRPVGGN